MARAPPTHPLFPYTTLFRSASGGVYRFKDGREVFDHVYATFEYPNGQTAVFSSVESNAFDDYYEMFMGTKGTLILDRKSTRLNSSHGYSSYAVIRLKKKTAP